MSLISEKQAEWEAYQQALETFHETAPKPENIRLPFGTDAAVIYQPGEDVLKVYNRGGIMRFHREDAQALSAALLELFAESDPEDPQEPEAPTDPEE
jgi:hypothetical protein